MIVLPFRLDPGIVVEERVANADIWPTLLDLLGLPPLPGADGKSLLPLIEHAAGLTAEAPPELASRPIFSQLDRRWGTPKEKPDPLVAVTDGNLRYFLPVARPEAAELFDSSTDPGRAEQPRRAAHRGRRPLAQRSRTAISRTRRAPGARRRTTVEIDELRLNQLRALGYVIK